VVEEVGWEVQGALVRVGWEVELEVVRGRGWEGLVEVVAWVVEVEEGREEGEGLWEWQAAFGSQVDVPGMLCCYSSCASPLHAALCMHSGP
jgi:hypothetical protein